MKLNIGCGFNKLDGYVNVDMFAECAPDKLWDLNRTPWPFEDDSVDEIVAHHVLEHLGQDVQVFFAIIREIYRVVRHDGRFKVTVPHPMSMAFHADPTHVRSFTVTSFSMLSRAKNQAWVAEGRNMTMLALFLDVNFETVQAVETVDEPWRTRMRSGELTPAEVRAAAEQNIGVIKEIKVELRVDKTHRREGAGRPAL
jgi:SAM-dependent methyltransferase